MRIPLILMVLCCLFLFLCGVYLTNYLRENLPTCHRTEARLGLCE